MLSLCTLALAALSFVLLLLTGWSGFAFATAVSVMLAFVMPLFDGLLLLFDKPRG